MIEEWRNVVGYDGKYQVNREGEVRRLLKRGRVKPLTPYIKKTSTTKKYVVKMTKNKKGREEILAQIVAAAFIGPCPESHVPYHINGVQSDNYANNIAYISRAEMGKRFGMAAGRKPVAKIDCDGEIVEVYPSARECGRKNFMSYQTVIDRCNGKCKSAFAPDGYAYAWDDSEKSVEKAIRKIELSKGYLKKAELRETDFMW